MVLLLLTFCLLLLPFWEAVIVLCFALYFMSILVLQSSWWGRESWLLCLIRLSGDSWWLSGSSSRCHGVVCGLWLWYFLIILTIFDFEIVYFPFLDGDVPRYTSYGVYISQLIRFARASSHVADFNTGNKLLTQKLLKHKAFCIINFAKPFLNFIDDTILRKTIEGY